MASKIGRPPVPREVVQCGHCGEFFVSPKYARRRRSYCSRSCWSRSSEHRQVVLRNVQTVAKVRKGSPAPWSKGNGGATRGRLITPEQMRGLRIGWYRQRPTQGKLGSSDPQALAWAAGLFEGEGTFVLGDRRRTMVRGVQFYPSAALLMKDEDVVRKFAAVMGVGRVSPARGNGKPLGTYHRWGVNGFEATQAVGVLFWKWLGARRRKRFTEVMRGYLTEFHLQERGGG